MSTPRNPDQLSDADAGSGRGAGKGLRIALFSGNYNCVRDGANRALNRLVRFLLDSGAEVRVYSPTTAEPAFEPAGDLVSAPSFAIPFRPEYRIATGLNAALREDIRRFAPTHVHLSAPDWLGTNAERFARELGVKVVISHHTNFESYLDYYRLGFLRGWLRKRLHHYHGNADLILLPNRPIAEQFAAGGYDNLAIWSRGVDRSLFTPERRAEPWRSAAGYDPDEPVVLFFGRVVMEKGLAVFAAAIAELRRRGHKVRPLVVGDGPAAEWFRDRLGPAHFTGHLDGDALGRAVASADIFINPSDTEAFGNTNLEAMAAGLAIVSADVPSASALIDDGVSGLLVSPRDPIAYADAVEDLIRSPEKRRELASAAMAESGRYNWDEVLGVVLKAYRDIGSPCD
ncbi:glycosyltransferase family 1 protein [Sphingomonas sinipercae]|uniref:Glycosyltransferase family 1 protein n=1 Tax=Sphingomonas sinipercae TaxID=2714944 RepID=A0A6G7ZKK2_9SPHN|nr:glycosyltransferase family 1 protein [Sphingomonas sinipercae]QIL01463.1 glycosyltransferase family 1 protein [Sphingomonas sinipercae]